MTAPSIEAFLTQPGEELDDDSDLGALEAALRHTSPLVSIAESLRQIAEAASESRLEEDRANENASLVHEARAAYDDLEGKHQVLFTLVEEIEQAIGKSTAKPSLAVKALIDAWKKPEAPAAEGTVGVDSSGPEIEDQDVVYVCPHCQTGWGEVVDPCTECGRAASGEMVIHPAAPAHDADVEEWRQFARRAAPDFEIVGLDQMNRSQIRTMLGIEQLAGA